MSLYLLKKGAVVALAAASATAAFADSYLIVHSAPEPYAEEVRQRILGTGIDATIDLFPAASGSPTVNQLLAYDAVLVFSSSGFQNNGRLGDNLANYVDQGGGVVNATFSLNPSGSTSLQGRFVSGGYSAFIAGPSKFAIPRTLGAIHQPEHPLMEGVSSFHGGPGSYHNQVTLAAGAQLIASYDNGMPLIAARQIADNSVVGLNFFPPSNANASEFWVSSTDGGRIMANALKFSAGPKNIAPTAEGEAYESEAGSAYYVAAPGVLSNDSDPDGDALTAILLSTTSHGTLDLQSDGSFTYVPDAGFTGQDSFRYKVKDGEVASAPVRVTIKVVDTTAPVFGELPEDLVADAVSGTGAPVFFTLPSASDAVDGEVEVKATHQPGSHFGLGGTVVTLEATDSNGNKATAQFLVKVQFDCGGLYFSGPAAKKAGSTVQARFKLQCDGVSISDAKGKLMLRTDAGWLKAASFTYNPESGEYQAQWKTKGLTAGVYDLNLDLGDGVERTTTVTLK